MTKIESFQRQLSNGSWIDCEERAEEFFNKSVKNDYRKLTEQVALEVLNSGKTISHGTDWYDNCRLKPAYTEPVILKDFVPDNEEYGY